jgi:hypothetical protein
MAAPVPRSPLSVGIDWASRITTLGFEFALPALLGHYIDRKAGSNPVGLLVGMVFGFVAGMVHLLRIARDSSKPT